MVKKRITVKIGSNVLSRPDGSLDVTRMSALVDQLVLLREAGYELILVSSGSISSGRSMVSCSRKRDSVDKRQLFSAVGQVRLIQSYYSLFRDRGITIGQVLTTKEAFSTRQQYLNQRNCMEVMLEEGVLPIVNENDTISVTELMFTDNDELSGLVASMMGCSTLVILSNVDGVLAGDRLLPLVHLGEDISSYVLGVRSGFGRGGMMTKTAIARRVAEEGIEVIIANGKRENILTDIFFDPEKAPHTRFEAAKEGISEVKKWIAHSEGFAKGEIRVNEGAAEALLGERVVSLLPVGVTEVVGEFQKDDLVRITDAGGRLIGVGKVAYGSEEVIEAMGKKGRKPVVHYDYLFIE